MNSSQRYPYVISDPISVSYLTRYCIFDLFLVFPIEECACRTLSETLVDTTVPITKNRSAIIISRMNESRLQTAQSQQENSYLISENNGHVQPDVASDRNMSRPRTVDVERFDCVVEQVLNNVPTSDNIISDLQDISTVNNPTTVTAITNIRSRSISKVSRPVTTLMKGSAIPEDGDENSFIIDKLVSIGYHSTSKYLKKNISLADSAMAGQSSDKDATLTSMEEEAAVMIQRFWRYHHMRAHYTAIMGSVRRRSEQKPGESDLTHLASTVQESLRDVAEPDREAFITPSSPSPNNSSPLKDSIESNGQSHSLGLQINHGYLANAGSMIIHETGSSVGIPSPTASVFSDSGEDDIQKRIKSKCINEFNMDCNKGMRNLIANKVIDNDAYRISLFLKSETRLSKTRIGEYLGYGEDMHNTVLRSFVDLFDFVNIEFDVALRRLLRAFRLPGEAQKIDRIMGEFARRYCVNNPHIFANTDTAYVLAYSLIMLNTDAHNPNVKNKMTLRDFLRNNRGIDNKKSLPDEFLERLYTNIVENEIQMNDHDNMFVVREICEQISGRFGNIVSPHRRFIGEFQFNQVQDYAKQNTYKGDRILFLFNDLLLITKPRVPQMKEASSSNTSTESADQNANTKSNQHNKHEHGSYQFRYLFNLVQMDVVDKPDTQWHKNYVELVNPNGTLIGMSFRSLTEKESFLNAIKEYLQEVTDLEDEKLSRLIMSTAARQEACKTLLEKAYGFLASATSAGKRENDRFSKFKSLRYARTVLTAVSTILTGKRKTNMPKELYAELKPIEKLLNEFPSNRIMLGVPSQCPDNSLQASSERTTSFIKSNTTTDFLQVDSEGSGDTLNGSLGRRARRASLAASVNLSRAASVRSQKSADFNFE